MVSVQKGSFFGLCRVAEGLNFFWAVRVSVGTTTVNQLLGPPLIYVQPLTLNVRAVFSADVRTFIVDKSKRFEACYEVLAAARNFPFLVGVFKPQDELSVI
jgi:hypothetical protein